MKILFAEDDVDYQDELQAKLESEGYEVRSVPDGEAALKAFAGGHFDLVLLDLDMPRRNGKVVCREVRRADATLPIVILTENDSALNEATMLDLGADYFVSKQNCEVLCSVIRRMTSRGSALSVVGGLRNIVVGKVVVDASRMTPTEADLLRYFVSRRGETVSRDDIISTLRGSGFACEDSLVYTHVSNLRKKLAAYGIEIETVHSRGYRLA